MTNSVIVVFLFAIVAALLAGMVFLVKDGGTSRRRTVRALTLRIGLSLALIVFLVLSYHFGWIQPHGVRP